MNYGLNLQFRPKFEFMCSLHTYLCRKSHKKLDLTPSWAEKVREQLSPELSALLEKMDINAEWKLAYLLIVLAEQAETPEEVIAWLESLTAGDLYERFAPYGNQFPADMNKFQSQIIQVLKLWNEQYYRNCEPDVIHQALCQQTQARNNQYSLQQTSLETFIDDTTGGLVFEPVEGIDTLLLIPQYHFQPVNIVYQYGRLLLCHYSSRIDLHQQDFMSAHDYRMIRALAEKSRLKILRYLHEGPKSFIEIVRELKLSKGITHDHVSKLRSAGLIYAHFEGENLTEYSLRLKGMEQMQQQLLNYIEHKEVVTVK